MDKTFYDWRTCRDQDIIETFNMLGGRWTRLVKGANGRPKRVRDEKPLCINPGHDDHLGGNFSLNREKGVFYCQACGCGGSVIDLVMLAQSCSFQEAVRWIGDHFKLPAAFKPSPPEFEEHEHMLSAEDGALIGLCKTDQRGPCFPFVMPEKETIFLDEDDEDCDDLYIVVTHPRVSPLRELYYSENPQDKEMYYYIVAKQAHIALKRLEKDWESFSPALPLPFGVSGDVPTWFEVWLDQFLSDYERAKGIYENAMKWYRRYYDKGPSKEVI